MFFFWIKYHKGHLRESTEDLSRRYEVSDAIENYMGCSCSLLIEKTMPGALQAIFVGPFHEQPP